MLSQKPYLIRAIYEWCCDSDLTPYLITLVDEDTSVPNLYVENGQIVLNIAATATKDLLIEKDWITASATFGGIHHDLAVPMGNVIAIFAKENGQGMQFNAEPKPQQSSGIRLIK